MAYLTYMKFEPPLGKENLINSPVKSVGSQAEHYLGIPIINRVSSNTNCIYLLS